jgi:hypothetical protein
VIRSPERIVKKNTEYEWDFKVILDSAKRGLNALKESERRGMSPSKFMYYS